MNFKLVTLFVLCAWIAEAQKVIPLYSGKPSGSENWDWQEAEMYSDLWRTRVVYNVSAPTLTVYLPPPATANGTAVVICPGGAFHALSIDSEGIDVAKWLNAKGVAAFVLKYRLVKSNTDDPVKELSAKMAEGKRFDEDNAKLIPLAINDGLEAIGYVKKNASEFNVNPDRVGIIGFSAGGTVAAGVTYQGKGETRPAFAAPIYAYLPPSMRDAIAPENAPALFIAAASDDQLHLAPHSIALYNQWLVGDVPVELHMYATGGHGFGMRTQYLPSDTWIDRFGEWLEARGLFIRSDSRNPPRASAPQEMLQRKRETEERFHQDWANLGRYEEENKKIGPSKPGENRVVFMGNSITARWITNRPEFFAKRPYVNRGIGGQTTAQMLIRFTQDVIDLQPEVVVILAGINDIAHATGPTTREAIMDNIAGMALLAKAHGIKVILSSVLPAYDFPTRPGLEPAGKVIELNSMIQAFARENDFHYLDYFSVFKDSRNGMKKEYSNDEVHPTKEGYQVMEPMVEKAINAVLKGK